MTTYTKVPHWLLAKVAAGEITATALVTYAAVGKYVNRRHHSGAWPSNRTLQADTGFSERSVREHLRSLEEVGAIERIERRAVGGRQTTNLIMLMIEEPPGSQPPPPAASRRNPEPDLGRTGSQPPPPPGSQPPPYEPEVVMNQSATSPSAAAGSHLRTEPTSSSDETNEPDLSRTRDTRTFPIVEQRKLTSWFGVGAHEGPAWEAVWETAQSFSTAQPSVEYEPQAHLAIYLSKCREERRRPRSDLWLRFFIEDRAKHIQVLREEADAISHHHETPQEREDRLNRRLPPVWDAPPSAAAETGDEQ